MRRGNHGQKSPKPNPYAGRTTCLRCDRAFESWDRRQNRLCPRCLEYLREEPSDEPSYTIKRSTRRSRPADDSDQGG
jgi:hypothetical protein